MKYLRFVKIEHTLFSLPVVFAGTLLALRGNSLSIREFLWIVLAASMARAAGFGFNRILDAGIDVKNPPTKSPENSSGIIFL